MTLVRRLGPRPVDYAWAWDLQRALHDDVAAGTAEDTVLLLEHEPVYTAGRRTEPLDRPLDGTPVIDVDPAEGPAAYRVEAVGGAAVETRLPVGAIAG